MKGKHLKSKSGYVKDWLIGLRADKYVAVARFLRQAVEEYAELNTHFYRRVYDFPFTYGELQNQPLVWHSMRTAGGIPFSEQPYEKRLRRKAPQKQRLDYWVSLRNENISLWIEYKHRIGFRNMKFRDRRSCRINAANDIGKKWQCDNTERLAKMDPSDYPDLLPRGGVKGVIKLNLLILPICQQTTDSEKVMPVSASDFISWGENKDILDRLCAETTPHWKAVWSLHPDLQRPDSWKDGEGKKWYFNYPGVFFLAQVV